MKRKTPLVAGIALLMISVFACKRGTQAGQASATIKPSPSQFAAPPAAPNPVAAPKPPEAVQAPQPVPSPQQLAAAANAPNKDKDQDIPLALGQETFHFISHGHRCPNGTEQTVDWWEIRDPANAVAYRKEYPADPTCEETVDVGASAINTKEGRGVLIDGEDLPSAPGTGGWVQVFGIHNGKLAPFGPPINVEGEFMEIATDPRRVAPVIPGRTVMVMNDILKFKIWTGNFHIIYPVLINWLEGKVEPSWRCLRSTSKGMIEQCSYPVTADPMQRKEATFVRLYAEADEGFTPKHVIVKPESKIEFLEADTPVHWSQDAGNISIAVDSSNLWLKIRVDGQEGWIHTEEDLQAVGLPESG